MLHARNVKPPTAGAQLVSVDEASVAKVPGLVKVVRKGNYLAVVCEREEQAIQAARQLKAEWQKPATAPFPASDDLFTYMRGATPTFSAPPAVAGRSRCRVQGRRPGDRSRLRRAVPGAHGHRAGARAGRPVERPAHHLLERHEVVRAAQRRGALPQPAARAGARGVDGRSAGLRPHRRRRRRLRGRVPGQGARAPGARAVDAQRRDGLGHQRPGLRREDARGARRSGQPHRARMERPRRRPQPRRLQRARHGAHRAAREHAQGDTVARDLVHAVEHVRRARTSAR